MEKLDFHRLMQEIKENMLRDIQTRFKLEEIACGWEMGLIVFTGHKKHGS